MSAATLFGGSARGGDGDKIIDGEALGAGIIENGEFLAVDLLVRGGDPQIEICG